MLVDQRSQLILKLLLTIIYYIKTNQLREDFSPVLSEMFNNRQQTTMNVKFWQGPNKLFKRVPRLHFSKPWQFQVFNKIHNFKSLGN